MNLFAGAHYQLITSDEFFYENIHIFCCIKIKLLSTVDRTEKAIQFTFLILKQFRCFIFSYFSFINVCTSIRFMSCDQSDPTSTEAPPYNFKLSSNQSREGRVCGGWLCYDRARLEVVHLSFSEIQCFE